MRLSISLLFLLLNCSCGKERTKCWECSVETISNEVAICTDPEQIMTLEPADVKIICDENAKEEYMEANEFSSERIAKDCPDGLRFYVVSKSPVCILQP